MKQTLAAILLLCALTVSAQTEADTDSPCPSLALRTNLLRWLTLTPNIGAEYRLAPRWTVMADYSWANYTYGGGDHRYALSEATAELRHRLGHKKHAYIGLYAVKGAFNYKLSVTGRQGNHWGTGVSTGYLVPLSCRWQLDLGAAVGYLCVQNGERYRHQDGLEVWREDFSRSRLSPLALRATLVYTLTKKGGGQ